MISQMCCYARDPLNHAYIFCNALFTIRTVVAFKVR